jgi:hypothetical protein
LLEIKELEGVKKYCVSLPLLVVKFISVEKIDSAFLVPLDTACSLFRLQLSLSSLISSKINAKDFFPGPALVSNRIFLLFELGNRSTISRVVVVLVTIVTPHNGSLRILRRLAYTTGNKNLFLIIYR